MSDEPSPKLDERRKSDDRFALLALLAGGALALAARRDAMLLAAGLALGLAGVLLAIRGDRPIEGRGWMRAAFVAAVLAVAARAALDVYQEWLAGQWFAEGATAGATEAGLRRLSHVTLILRVLTFAASACVLLAAVTNRLRK